MSRVTIEGTTTPSVELGRGERRTVAVTDHIRRLVRIGAVKVVDGSLDAPQYASGGPVVAPEGESLVALDSSYVVAASEAPAGGEVLARLNEEPVPADASDAPQVHDHSVDEEPEAPKPARTRRKRAADDAG